MPGVRLIELRGDGDATPRSFAPGLTVTGTRGPSGRTADDVVAAVACRYAGDARAEVDGRALVPEDLSGLAIERMVVRADDLAAKIAAHHPTVSGAAVVDAAPLALADDWDHVQARLAELAATGMPDAAALEALDRRVEHAQMKMHRAQGGPRLTPDDANKLRYIHEELEAAQRAVEKRASRRAMKKLEECEAAERTMLDQAGIASYLDFVLGVATTGSPEADATGEVHAELQALVAERDALTSAPVDDTEAQMMTDHAERIRRNAIAILGFDPGDDVAGALRSHGGDASPAPPGSTVIEVDAVLQAALEHHPWSDALGPLPIVFDDALSALPSELREDALEILEALSSEVQIIVCSDDPILHGWRQRHPVDAMWADREAEMVAESVEQVDVEAEAVQASVELDAAEAAERFELDALLGHFDLTHSTAVEPAPFESAPFEAPTVEPVFDDTAVAEPIFDEPVPVEPELIATPDGAPIDLDLTPIVDDESFAPVEQAPPDFWGRDAEFESEWLAPEPTVADDPFAELATYDPALEFDVRRDAAVEEALRREAEAREAAEAAARQAEAARIEAERQAAEMAGELERMRAEQERRELAKELAEQEEAEAARLAAVRAEQLAQEQAAVEAAARAEEERRLREESEQKRREAEDAAIVAELKARAQAIISAEDRERVRQADQARREAETLAQEAIQRQAEIEEQFRARDAEGSAQLAYLEAELAAARQALEDSRLRARELARIEAEEVAARDAEELSRRAAMNRLRSDDSEAARHEAEMAAVRASAAAQRAEDAAARAEVAVQQEAADARALAQLQTEANAMFTPVPPAPPMSVPTAPVPTAPAPTAPAPAVGSPPAPAMSEIPVPPMTASAPMPAGPFVQPIAIAPAAATQDPRIPAAAEVAARAEAAAVRAETSSGQIEFVSPIDRATYAASVRSDASEARRLAGELANHLAELRSAGAAVPPATVAEVEQSARRAEISAMRAEEAAQRLEWRAMQDANRARPADPAPSVDAAASAAVLPSNLAALEAAELEQMDNDSIHYELPEQEIEPELSGRRRRKAEKKAKRQAKSTEQVVQQAAKLAKQCKNHSLEDAVGVCGRCEGSFCRHCIVKVGSRSETLCVDCALQAAGVRSHKRRR
ncbi:MAG: hypothetical protein ACOYNI_07665 [Acidimicrobiia bacterium]